MQQVTDEEQCEPNLVTQITMFNSLCLTHLSMLDSMIPTLLAMISMVISIKQNTSFTMRQKLKLQK